MFTHVLVTFFLITAWPGLMILIWPRRPNLLRIMVGWGLGVSLLYVLSRLILIAAGMEPTNLDVPGAGLVAAFVYLAAFWRLRRKTPAVTLPAPPAPGPKP